MDISAIEQDALTELANLGLSRAARQLSMLLNDSIEVTVPKVHIVLPKDVPTVLNQSEQAPVSAVWQRLSGNLQGAAMLMLPCNSSKLLVKSLIGSAPQMGGFDLRAIEHEAMTEIGNIIISAAMASISDMLGQEILLSVPDYAEDELGQVLQRRVMEEDGEPVQVILMFANLQASQRDVSGSLVLMLTVPSLEALLARLRELLGIVPPCGEHA